MTQSTDKAPFEFTTREAISEVITFIRANKDAPGSQRAGDAAAIISNTLALWTSSTIASTINRSKTPSN
jgi:hypothetical protein